MSYDLIFTQQFEKVFSKLKDRALEEQIWKKLKELEQKAPLGKKLKENPYWSIHINRYRVIYELRTSQILIINLLERKHDYREL